MMLDLNTYNRVAKLANTSTRSLILILMLILTGLSIGCIAVLAVVKLEQYIQLIVISIAISSLLAVFIMALALKKVKAKCSRCGGPLETVELPFQFKNSQIFHVFIESLDGTYR